MIFEHMDRIVFAGDSVTDMESAQPVGEGLFENVGKSYVRIVENMLAAFYPDIYPRDKLRYQRKHKPRPAAALRPRCCILKTGLGIYLHRHQRRLETVRQPGYPGRAGIPGGVPFQRREDDSFRKRQRKRYFPYDPILHGAKWRGLDEKTHGHLRRDLQRAG